MNVAVLQDWALDDRCYAARLGAAVMGVRVTLRTAPGMPAEGPVLADADTGEALATGAGPVLARLAARAAGPWRDADPARLAWAADLLERFSTLRRAALNALTPDDAPGSAGGAILRAIEDDACARRLAGLDWLGGAAPGIVDIAAFPVAALGHDLGLPYDLFPETRRFVARVRTLPGFVTMPGVPELH